ncbi:hypothetical protein B0J11DRAFT_415220, partial [Dendryphion nanum]
TIISSKVEAENAAVDKVETAWICHSGLFANIAMLETAALSNDATVWDKLSLASTIVGLRVTMADNKLSFEHNDPDSLHDVLTRVKANGPGSACGAMSVLICVIPVYNVEGDTCPFK